MSGFMDIVNAGKAKLQEWHVKGVLQDSLMKHFPESVVGLKNMQTISDTIKGHIQADKPELAVAYAKDQMAKIDAQSGPARRAPRY